MSKPILKQNSLEEAKTQGYMIGYVDGRNEILDQLIKFNLLKKNWKQEYNKKCGASYQIK